MARVQKVDLERVAGEYGLSKVEDLYASLGYGKFSAPRCLQSSPPTRLRRKPPRQRFLNQRPAVVGMTTASSKSMA